MTDDFESSGFDPSVFSPDIDAEGSFAHVDYVNGSLVNRNAPAGSGMGAGMGAGADADFLSSGDYVSTGGFQDVSAFVREAAKAWENAADVPQGTYSGVTPAIIPGEKEFEEYKAQVAAGKALDQDIFAPNDKLWDGDAPYAELATEVLEETRVTLMMSFRFMDAALWRMPFAPMTAAKSTATDGAKFFFSAGHVVRRYQESQAETVRDFLHTIMHCVFRHPFDSDHEDPEAWGLACDVVVETITREMCAGRFDSEGDQERERLSAQLRNMIGVLTPFKLYRLFTSIEVGADRNEETGMTMKLLGELLRAFTRDAHQPWAVWRKNGGGGKGAPEEKRRGVEDVNRDAPEPTQTLQVQNQPDGDDDQEGESSGNGNDDQNSGESSSKSSGESQEMETPQQPQGQPSPGQGENGEAPDTEDGEQDTNSEDAEGGQGQDQGELGDEEEERVREASDEDEGGSQSTDSEGDESSEGGTGETGGEDEDEPAMSDMDNDLFNQMRKEWTDISKQMEMDLQSYSARFGDQAGSLMANLKVSNRRRGSYIDFLRRFARLGEDMRVNDDEFDYIFYTYGLSRYGNMPLVEPLEYQENNRIREFVIALDTSGSCSGALIKEFVERTYEILSQPEGFGDEICVHIVQCDRNIQSDTIITSLEEMKKFSDNFWVKGMGGTDFRPVFKYIDNLREDGYLRQLRGLVYFTDGIGMYPETPPDYRTAFVFVDEDGLRRRVPPWAMKVVMDEDEIRTL